MADPQPPPLLPPCTWLRVRGWLMGEPISMAEARDLQGGGTVLTQRVCVYVCVCARARVCESDQDQPKHARCIFFTSMPAETQARTLLLPAKGMRLEGNGRSCA